MTHRNKQTDEEDEGSIYRVNRFKGTICDFSHVQTTAKMTEENVIN